MPRPGKPAAETAHPRHTRGPGLLKQQAYEQLRELVLSGQLSQMPFISERLLAKQLGMSNTPVRSAIERLELDGMLEIGPQRGIVVRELSNSEIADHYEIREALETFVTARLAGKLTPGQQQELLANVAALDKSVEANRPDDFIRLDGDFHLLLAEFWGNADIERVLRQLRDRVHRVIVRIVKHVPKRVAESAAEHRQIAKALIQGDGAEAAELMRLHLRRGLELLVPNRGAR